MVINVDDADVYLDLSSRCVLGAHDGGQDWWLGSWDGKVLVWRKCLVVRICNLTEITDAIWWYRFRPVVYGFDRSWCKDSAYKPWIKRHVHR